MRATALKLTATAACLFLGATAVQATLPLGQGLRGAHDIAPAGPVLLAPDSPEAAIRAELRLTATPFGTAHRRVMETRARPAPPAGASLLGHAWAAAPRIGAAAALLREAVLREGHGALAHLAAPFAAGVGRAADATMMAAVVPRRAAIVLRMHAVGEKIDLERIARAIALKQP